MTRAASAASGKPLVASVGAAPPPASKGRLLPLSRLGKLVVEKTIMADRQRVEQRETNKPTAQPNSRVKITAHRPRPHAPPPSARTGSAQQTSSRKPEREVEKESGPAAEAAKDIQAPSKSRQLHAAEKYIVEREQKRVNGFDIPKHKLYTFSQDTAAEFVGLRRIDAQALALLRLGDGIAVLPVDDATAQRLKRLPRGQTVTVTAKGTIKTKGRSR